MFGKSCNRTMIVINTKQTHREMKHVALADSIISFSKRCTVDRLRDYFSL